MWGLPDNMSFKRFLENKNKKESQEVKTMVDNKTEDSFKPVISYCGKVRGDLHKLKNKPCEDYSASCSEKSGKYHIAIVADGHGSNECFRSAFGSKTAVEVTLEIFENFADTILQNSDTEKKFYDDIFLNSRYQSTIIRQLTDSIISEWSDRVEEDYEKNPPTEEELQKAELAEKAKLNIPHIYGTTLIAALWLPECLIVVHQGDGRCVIFYDDGTANQPVPWDERCIGTAVTSMCDEDAATRIRHYVLNLSEKKVIACYLGSDGVEDAYRDTYDEKGPYCMGDMGGVYTFYKNLTCQLIDKGYDQFKIYLDQMLPEFSANGLFSRTGSGDDVSVAGIVDVEAAKKFYDQFMRDIKVYELEEQLFWKEDELQGKTRKHGILLKRMNEAKDEIPKAKEAIADIEKQIESWSGKQVELESKIQKSEQEFQNYSSTKQLEVKNEIQKSKHELIKLEQAYVALESESKEGRGDKGWKIAEKAQNVIETIRNVFNCTLRQRDSLKSQRDKMAEKYKECIDKIDKLHSEMESAKDYLHQAEEKFAEAKKKFEEYDQNYQRISNEGQQIKDEIAKVLNSSNEEKTGDTK